MSSRQPEGESPRPPVSWRRNLAILFGVQLLSTAGFSLIFPFLPLYVREIGISTGGSVEFWAGMVFSVQAATMMIFSPIWGNLADRRGRKLMLERATIGGALLLVAMGFAQNAEQLVVLRAFQGAVTGVASAANALVAAQTPKAHSGSALGLINMGRWVGTAGGPVVGGILGEMLGFRESFWITGTMLGVAGLCVVFFVQEDFVPADKDHQPGFWSSYQELFAAPGMLALYVVTFLRSMGATLVLPMLSLFVLSLNAGQDTGTAAATGLVIGLAAATSAVSAVYLGQLGDRVGHTRILMVSAMLAVVAHVPQAWVTAVWQLVLLQAVGGLAVGGLVPSTAALMNLWAPAGNQGATYGLDNSVQASARTVAPLLAASIAGWFGFRGVFLASAAVYGIIAVLAMAVAQQAVRRGMPAAGGSTSMGQGVTLIRKH